MTSKTEHSVQPSAAVAAIAHGAPSMVQADASAARSLRGWRSPLAAAVSTGLLFEGVTGLWIFLAPFSIAGQLQVLLHVLLGVVLVVLYLPYQVRHFWNWYRQKLTAVMMLGYLLAAAVLTSIVSGTFVTWQAAMGPRLSDGWDLTHLVSGVATIALVVAHVALAAIRRASAGRGSGEFRAAMRQYATRTTCQVALLGVSVAVTAWYWPREEFSFPVPADYSLSEYVNADDEYQGNPFAPSYATTVDAKLLDPKLLTQSSSCGAAGCHEQVYGEWESSAHRFAAMNPPFQAVQREFASDRQPAETRYCAGCHDPISLLAGAKDIHNLDLSSAGTNEGCSCAFCHSISKVDTRGNADYVLTPPEPYLWEHAAGARQAIAHFLIRAYPRQHLQDYDRPVLRSAEFCGACHKQFIPEALNRFGMAASQNQFDEWRNSHWRHDDVQSSLNCIDCHMRLVPDSSDPAAGESGAVRRHAFDGKHRHHGTIATNMFMPKVLKLPHWEEQVRLTEEWIRGETVIEEIADLWPPGPVASIEVRGPNQATAGDEVKLQVVVVNRKAGHNLITGPLDFMRAWTHVRVSDADGNVFAEWGGIDPSTRWILDSPGELHEIGNSRQAGTLVLEGRRWIPRGTYSCVTNFGRWQAAKANA